jgi:hypothetical protein
MNLNEASNNNINPVPGPRIFSSQHPVGCADKILAWMDHVTDVLFVIGFCIIVFLKGCFLAILRYEIKEMIQKIRLLNGDEGLRSAAMNELIGLTSMYNDEGGGGSEELECETGSGPGPTSTETVLNEKNAVPPFHPPHQHHHHHRGSVGVNHAEGPPAPPQKRYQYPPFGNHLNSNNMVYRLQRQQSIQKQQEQQQQQQQQQVEEDFDSSSALLAQGTTAESVKGGKEIRGGGGRLNSLPVPIPYPRNGNNNSMEMTTTTALVTATSITAGATPLASATTSQIH